MEPQTPKNLKYVINSRAPIRICDNGGWTDTWFARHGKIFNIAVSPFVEVQITVYQSENHEGQIVINAKNYGDRYSYKPNNGWIKHPLLEAAIDYMRVPRGISAEVTIFSEAPPGASTGTSAAVAVALIGALDNLSPDRMSPHEVAYTAHKIETEILGQQSGIQDQLCSAYGGINYIEMHNYPIAKVSPIRLPDEISLELERRLVLIYLGKTHQSSHVHETVIRSLTHTGPDSPQLVDLRKTAPRSRDALCSSDFSALGQAMIDNTQAQGRLHQSLISSDAEQVIEIAKEHGALGWKVNGAGGEGGSMTILCNERADMKHALICEIESEKPSLKNIPLRISRRGLRVWRVNI